LDEHSADANPDTNGNTNSSADGVADTESVAHAFRISFAGHLAVRDLRISNRDTEAVAHNQSSRPIRSCFTKHSDAFGVVEVRK